MRVTSVQSKNAPGYPLRRLWVRESSRSAARFPVCEMGLHNPLERSSRHSTSRHHDSAVFAAGDPGEQQIPQLRSGRRGGGFASVGMTERGGAAHNVTTRSVGRCPQHLRAHRLLPFVGPLAHVDTDDSGVTPRTFAHPRALNSAAVPPSPCGAGGVRITQLGSLRYVLCGGPEMSFQRS